MKNQNQNQNQNKKRLYRDSTGKAHLDMTVEELKEEFDKMLGINNKKKEALK